MPKIASMILLTTMLAIAGCTRTKSGSFANQNQGAVTANRAVKSQAATFTEAEGAFRRGESQSEPTLQKVSLDSASINSESIKQAEVTDRKIIRNAEMTLEISDPGVGLQKIAAIAEKNGGFVVSSESKENNAQNLPTRVVTVVARVPAAHFGEVIEAIRRIDGRITVEKISGMDVTEEYIDLEARIRTKRALELQFLDIMRQARKISDALEVQSKLAEVRTEIESLEGRRRFLENKSALSTISITLQTPAPLLATTTNGFQQSVKMAFGDGLDAASEIVLGIIRFAMIMIPIALFIVCPCWFLYRWLRRYFTWQKTTTHMAGVTDQVE
jgi:uncharacterized protein DUF4349